jgi:hypothetical protein
MSSTTSLRIDVSLADDVQGVVDRQSEHIRQAIEALIKLRRAKLHERNTLSLVDAIESPEPTIVVEAKGDSVFIDAFAGTDAPAPIPFRTQVKPISGFCNVRLPVVAAL